MNDPLEGKKILWVEDDAFLSDIIVRKVSQYKCRLYIAKNGEEALNILGKERPDVLLMDVVLPGTNGFDLLQIIRKTENGRDVPVVFLSNVGEDAERMRAEAMGAKKYMIKAVSTLDQIIAEIRKALS